MAIDPEDLRKHYASLGDDELRLLEREDLTPLARKVFDFEVRRRGLDIEQAIEHADDTDTHPTAAFSFFRSPKEDDADEDHWSEKAVAVTIFSGTLPDDAARARDALLGAGIPCEITEHEVDPSEEPVSQPHKEYRLMVPEALNLQAVSVLDTAVFNERVVDDWKTQLESLSDAELAALNIDTLCAGLVDRVERMRKAYRTEVARRSK